MKTNPTPSLRPAAALRLFAAAALSALALGACSRSGPAAWQGYLEGDYVYVAAPLAGQLTTLAVAKGQRVAAGAPLFTLEHAAELDARRQAAAQVRADEARLADLEKGQRPTELAALEAQLAQARTAAELARLELARQQQLARARVNTPDDLDRARLGHTQAEQLAGQLAAQLATAQLGGRPDAIAAARAVVSADAAALARAEWNVRQKTQTAPQAGLVFDTLYREGEFVGAGSPVVVLLPPANIKVRFFVPEPALGALRAGESVRMTLDGRAAPLAATVSYVSPQAEFTPPVLYNRDNRAKLVYMIEAVFAPADARDLHPGQPVGVTPAP